MRNISLEEVKNRIDEFIAKSPGFLAGIDFVIGVSRGGLVPAALLAAKIDKPLVAAYINKQDETFFDRAEWIEGKNALVVDDIIRSGKTLWLLRDYLERNAKPTSISFFAPYRVVSLKNDNYNLQSFAQEVNENVIMPWD